jgi:hypothetical protein
MKKLLRLFLRMAPGPLFTKLLINFLLSLVVMGALSSEGLLHQFFVPNGPLPLDEADCLGLLAVPNFKLLIRNFLNSAADYFSAQKKTFFSKRKKK